MIRFKLKERLEQENKTMYWLSKESGIRPNTISQWVNNEELEIDKKIKSINVDTLDSICETLNCDISDIIEHVKKDAAE
ncbi:helix-turn-helix domain-containing protein [Mesobacillus foraminis]|uniref:Putative transcriptional regulator n=1 Tax=Mesobacillus foraminis TaxID=279826 RepID=A0A4V6NKR3_9BACI|nr:helix-turn-helix transcriptional regulator [Mesobacillus foraminis]TCN25510.1 putative transcriptional regulator [Mesobacillus foraminis]